jgi:omega-amidase
MNDLTVALIQTSLYWEKIEQNLEHFGKLLEPLKDKTDVIFLPEMFTTGFSMEPAKLAEEMNGNSVSWLRREAAELGCVVAGSIMVTENHHYYNRLIWMQPSGEFSVYDKRHLFRLGNEHFIYTAGKEQLIQKIGDWRVKPLICYDLRFPVWSRNRDDYDLLVYVANWPESRREVWKTLLKARAIENQAYVIGVNRVGSDGNGIDYSGDSAIIDPKGLIISNIQPHEESIEIVTLSMRELIEFRDKFPVLPDRDEFEIQ